MVRGSANVTVFMDNILSSNWQSVLAGVYI